LADVKDKLIQSITITVDSNRLESDDVAELSKHIQEMQENPRGNAQTSPSIDVKWNIYGLGSSNVLHMKSRTRCYQVSKKLMDYLNATEYLTYKIN